MFLAPSTDGAKFSLSGNTHWEILYHKSIPPPPVLIRTILHGRHIVREYWTLQGQVMRNVPGTGWAGSPSSLPDVS